MACFQQMVLDYLEHYQPQEFEALKAERRLRARMDELVEELYAERDREYSLLVQQYPESPEEQLMSYAEQMAILAVLPALVIQPLDDEMTIH